MLDTCRVWHISVKCLIETDFSINNIPVSSIVVFGSEYAYGKTGLTRYMEPGYAGCGSLLNDGFIAT